MNSTTIMLSKLNERQAEAVLYFDSPLLVLAGAGSGKTRVLTHKIAYLIQEMKISPYNIFAVTFTNKAANEMKQRVESLTSIPVRGMWVGTFHSMCVRIIKMYRREMGGDQNFSIYDSDDSRHLVKKIIEENELDKLVDAKSACKLISKMKNAMVSTHDFAQKASNPTESNIALVYRKYQELLKRNNAFDFDDLLLETVSILKKDPLFREKLHSMFRYVLVDEYQDTNYVQYVMLRLMHSDSNHITVVGDDDQSIYGFRGAEVGNILKFDTDFKKTRIVKLEQNYRSTEAILEAANKVISNNENRKEKVLWCDKKGGENVKVVFTEDERAEASFIAREIEKRRREGNSLLKDFAVLYRTNAQSRPFEEQFRKRNINYTVVGSIKFFERKEIKDILAYMSLVVNPADSVSFNRVINVPRRGLGERGVAEIRLFAERNNITLTQSAFRFEEYKENLSKQAAAGIAGFRNLMEELEKTKENAAESVEKLIQLTDYHSIFSNLDEIERISKLENIQELINSVREFSEKNDDASVAEYLDMISLYTDIDDADDEKDSVLIMTVHNAKGLEFETVFIAGLEEGVFPHYNSFETPNGIEEERRLMYVAMTRAKKNLCITSAAMRKRYGTGSMSVISRFIREIEGDEFVPSYTQRIKPAYPVREGNEFESEAKREEETERPHRKESLFKTGDRVEHPFYGRGVIKNLKGSGEDTIATVSFISGETKKIFLQYANMKRI
ncbi:MAG: 3'-5' exonuclease [bacterium]|nr:3'-5' exonuclease [bacterium]